MVMTFEFVGSPVWARPTKPMTPPPRGNDFTRGLALWVVSHNPQTDRWFVVCKSWSWGFSPTQPTEVKAREIADALNRAYDTSVDL